MMLRWGRVATLNATEESTDDRPDDELRALMEKTPDAEFLRHMIGSAAQRLMELEVGGLTGAPHGVKSAARSAQRPFDRLRRPS